MKIEITPYDPAWPATFSTIKNELQQVLSDLNPKIEHIGSTAVPDLAAKPIIDVAVGLAQVSELDKAVEPMIQNHYIYYKAYNASMPLRRLFVGLKDSGAQHRFNHTYAEAAGIPHAAIAAHRLCHVHVWEYGSSEWIRHIAFREYLMAHPSAALEYAQLKQQLSTLDWRDGNAYNDGKNRFVKALEAKAVSWYAEGQGGANMERKA